MEGILGIHTLQRKALPCLNEEVVWALVTVSCMFFPAVMSRQHAQPMAPGTLSPQSHPAQSPAAGLMAAPSALTTQQQHQQKLRLQRIQMERERIRVRQEELMRQVGRRPHTGAWKQPPAPGQALPGSRGASSPAPAQ